MKLTIKEVLIWFKMLGITYHDQFNLFKTMIQTDQINRKWSLQDINHLIRSQPLKKMNQHRFNLSIDEKMGHQLSMLAQNAFMIGEANYPNNWLQLPQPPLLIFYQGDLSIMNIPLVSIIGTRKISPYGKQITRQLVEALTENKIGIVSGLALGVDQIAHETAAYHHGKTIGIIPNGFNYFYPRKNAQLQKHMRRHQLLLSEYLPTQNVRKHQFIMRNRLVAGLTPITIVIEAAKQSGSLITANYAIHFNRELFALPGPINQLQSQGCNDLIYHGAIPIVSIEHTIVEIAEILATRESF